MPLQQRAQPLLQIGGLPGALAKTEPFEPTDAECAQACVEEHDASYVLVDEKAVYKLSDQRAPKAFAGKKVKVVGTLDAASSTITVTSITGA